MPKLYGPVNGQARQVTKLYGPVNGVAKRITKLYGSVRIPAIQVSSYSFSTGNILNYFTASTLESSVSGIYAEQVTGPIELISFEYTASSNNLKITVTQRDAHTGDSATWVAYNGVLNSAALLVAARLGCNISTFAGNPPGTDKFDDARIVSTYSESYRAKLIYQA